MLKLKLKLLIQLLHLLYLHLQLPTAPTGAPSAGSCTAPKTALTLITGAPSNSISIFIDFDSKPRWLLLLTNNHDGG